MIYRTHGNAWYPLFSIILRYLTCISHRYHDNKKCKFPFSFDFSNPFHISYFLIPCFLNVATKISKYFSLLFNQERFSLMFALYFLNASTICVLFLSMVYTKLSCYAHSYKVSKILISPSLPYKSNWYVRCTVFWVKSTLS